MTPNIVMLCSLDTKAEEAQYLRDRIEERGATTTLIDVGYGRPGEIAATIGAEKVAAASGAGRILDVAPHDLHQRCPVILGSRNEVNRLLLEYLGQAEMG